MKLHGLRRILNGAGLGFALLSMVTVAAARQEAARVLDAKPLAEAKKALRAGFESQELVGLAAAILRSDGSVKTFSFGYADRESEVRVTDRTMFRWASISKPLTAVAAMQLARAGKLDLDADIRRHVPEFPATATPITARQLMQHRGGIVHYTNGKVVRTKKEYMVEHPFADTVVALDRFMESPLIAEPGTKHSYTTHGYMLLGAVVQRAGKAPFAAQVRKRIVRPLKLGSLRPDYQWEDIPYRATGYAKLGSKSLRSSNTDVSWKLPGGGYISNVRDMLGFAAALCDDTLLPRDAREEMWTPQKAPETKAGVIPYGLGFRIKRSDGRLLVSHGGSQEKTRTLMQVYPDERRAVVLMSNSQWANLGPVADAVWKALGDQ